MWYYFFQDKMPQSGFLGFMMVHMLWMPGGNQNIYTNAIGFPHCATRQCKKDVVSDGSGTHFASDMFRRHPVTKNILKSCAEEIRFASCSGMAFTGCSLRPAAVLRISRIPGDVGTPAVGIWLVVWVVETYYSNYIRMYIFSWWYIFSGIV